MEAEEEGGGAEPAAFSPSEIEYVSYVGEHHLPLIMNLVDGELSEPYSIFTYRYFVCLWPQLTFAFHKGKCVGTVVCKMGEHRDSYRGYIAMLVVIKPSRGKGIATELVTRSIREMMESGCEEARVYKSKEAVPVLLEWSGCFLPQAIVPSSRPIHAYGFNQKWQSCPSFASFARMFSELS